MTDHQITEPGWRPVVVLAGVVGTWLMVRLILAAVTFAGFYHGTIALTAWVTGG